MHKLDNISIVITTLGNSILKNTIDYFYNDIDISSDFEILITIPQDSKLDLNISKYKNLKIVKTKFKGQVYQRTEAFKLASKKFVLQLDDDVEISSKYILNLKNNLLHLGKDFAISPVFFNKDDKESCIYNLKNNNFLLLVKNLIASIVCKSKWGLKRSGTVTVVGSNYGVDYDCLKNDIINTEWLPGGCILHLNKNLILDDYFPYRGKAYCEDLMHSFLLTNNNIKLCVIKSSRCYTEVPKFPSIFKEKINFIRAYRTYYFRFGKLNIRYLIWQSINYFRVIL